MKMTIEIDCTPDEARRFFGLPDVAPMQAAMMEDVQRRVAAEMARLSPEAMIQAWMPLSLATAEQMQKFFGSMLTKAAPSSSD